MNKLSLIKGATKTLGGAKCAAKPRYFSNGLVNQGRGRGLKNFDDFFDHSWSDWNRYVNVDHLSDYKRPSLFSLFNEVEKNLPTLKSQQGWKPRSDIQETDSEFEIHAELPGVAKEDIKVSVEKGVLTLSGEKKSSIDETDQSKQFHRKERFHGKKSMVTLY